jgi:hypothetical protein
MRGHSLKLITYLYFWLVMVNEAIFSQPYIKPKVIGHVLGRTSRTTLSKRMEELATAKVLTPKRDGSEVYYLNDDLIRILAG